MFDGNVLQPQLPASIPSNFSANYTAFKEPGSQGHIQYIAKLLLPQISGSSLGQVPRRSGRVSFIAHIIRVY